MQPSVAARYYEVAVKWKQKLGAAGGIFLGAVFLFAAWAKALEPGAFAEQIQLEGLDLWFSAPTVVLIALALETALGVALILGLRPLWLLGPTAILVIFFLFLTGRNYWLVTQGLRDATASCGCFGSLLERSPSEAFWQDLFLLVPPLVLAAWFRHPLVRPLPVVRLLLSAVLAAGLVIYVGGNPDLSFVRIATEVAGTNREVESFVSTGNYRLVIDEKEVPEAEIYESDQSMGLLIRAPQLSNLILLRPLRAAVETLSSEDVQQEDGRITLLEDATSHQAGEFEVGPEGITFRVADLRVYLKNRVSGQ